MKKRLLVTIPLLFLVKLGLTCSCEAIFFCDMLKSVEKVTAIKGMVVKHKAYSGDTEAVYIKVLKTYRDDFGISDTIKIYGSELRSNYLCEYDVQSIEDTIRLAFTAEEAPVNPDSLTENFYGNKINTCTTVVLRTINGLTRGSISRSSAIYNRRGFYEYPERYFDDGLSNCLFDVGRTIKHLCDQSDFILYPNPVTADFLTILSESDFYTFDRVIIRDISGKFIREYYNSIFNSSRGFDIGRLPNGVYLFEIVCNAESMIKKIILNR